MTDCNHDTTQDGEWPGNDGGVVCYECFSDEADEAWWAMLPVALAMMENPQ